MAQRQVAAFQLPLANIKQQDGGPLHMQYLDYV